MGGNEMAKEALVYHELVHPLQIKAPEIFEFVQLKDSGVMVMEDAGEKNLEQQPHPSHFLEASRELAILRMKATANLESMEPKVIDSYLVLKEDFLVLLDDLLKSDKLSETKVLLKLKKVLPRHLERLYQKIPTSIIHNDYHAKNLLIQNNGIVPIDWSLAYLCPHLGDLYCLVNEAHTWCGLTREEILYAYLDVTGFQILAIANRRFMLADQDIALARLWWDRNNPWLRNLDTGLVKRFRRSLPGNCVVSLS